MNSLRVGLFNDSFPPTIDGVANVILNYARIIDQFYGKAVVSTPFYPGVKDAYPFEVIRYPSANIMPKMGYRAGLPLDPIVLEQLCAKKLDILHTHCPVTSAYLARLVRLKTNAPLILTWHTKYDIDIKKQIANDALRQASIKLLLNNAKACDEVWAVSNGAADNIRQLGYEGNVVVMPNGVDFSRCRASNEEVEKLKIKYGIKKETTVFLFVGRMMWYKGQKIILDGLAEFIKQVNQNNLDTNTTNTKNTDFVMFFIGEGNDRIDIENYAETLGIRNKCFFTGAILNRDTLRIFFSLADVFLFPSVYDTNGIVVREAAACSCASVLIKGSCAAEGIVDGESGYIIEENAVSMAKVLKEVAQNRTKAKQIGENAADNIYISWDSAVAKAIDRYNIVIERCKLEPHREFNTKLLDEIRNNTKEYFCRYFKYEKKLFEHIKFDTNEWMHDLIEEAKWNIKH